MLIILNRYKDNPCDPSAHHPGSSDMARGFGQEQQDSVEGDLCDEHEGAFNIQGQSGHRRD